MGVISRAIPTLLRGISQSSDATKQADHADIQDNADSNPVIGLVKRPGLQYLANISSSALGNVHIQTINRDANEQYVAVFSNGNVKVYELDGTEKTVEKPAGITYLNTSDPRNEIKTVTIADFTFVVNTKKTVRMNTTLSAYNLNFLDGNLVQLEHQAIIFITQATANTTYSVTVDSTTVTHDTSSDNPLSTTIVANNLRANLNALTGFTATSNGPVIWFRKNTGGNFDIDVNDTQGNTKMTLVKDSVQRFTDLPNVSPNGYVVEVKGDEDTNFDNYYLKFVTNNGNVFEEGQWEETLERDINFKFDYSTMPHVLIRKADGNFIFTRPNGQDYTTTASNATYAQSATTVTVTLNNHGFAAGDRIFVDITSGASLDGTYTITTVATNTFTYTTGNSATINGENCTVAASFTLPKWGERTVGDLISAPDPSFVGNTINNVFFFRNRLGFLSGDNVVLSRVSEFFNFFPETVLSVLDSEPIDVAASHTKVAILKNAVTMGEQLILFSEQTQFVLTSSADNLTPKTANVIVATEFESSDDAQPVGSGSSIYFLTKKGSFAGVREYITQGERIKDAANITIHVPRLIPSNIFKMAVSNNQDVLVLLGTDNPNKLYVNRWLYGGQGEKILNSWFTFTINSNRSFKNIDFIGNDLFAVVEEANKVTLEKIPFETNFKEANADFQFHLDHKVTEATTGVSVAYNTSTNITTFTVPYRLRAKMAVVGRYIASGTSTLKPGQVLTTSNSTDGSTSTITATGDFSNSKFIIGEPYEMHYRFSSQRLTTGSGGQGGSEYISGRLQLHHFYIKFEDTGFFKVEVTPDNRDTSTYKFTGRLLGAASASVGQINLETGTFRVPIMSRADRVNIDVKNDTFLPTQLASVEYEAMFHMRSRRV